MPRWAASVAHFLCGGLVAISTLAGTVLPLAGALFFLLYEMSEDRYLRDRAYRDILEALVGFCATVVGILLWRWL